MQGSMVSVGGRMACGSMRAATGMSEMRGLSDSLGYWLKRFCWTGDWLL